VQIGGILRFKMETSTSGGSLRLRADARRNRDKLLAAAVAAFAESGTDVSLEGIAKRAGVGIGTLYRHFPTRDALVEAAYRNELDRLTGSAEELLATLPPDAALAEWMDRFVAYATAKRGMKSALNAIVASGSDLFVNARRQQLDAISKLLDAGVAAGSIRSDVGPDDVLRAMGAVWQVDDPEQARKLLGLLMDGLRHGA
jgi:AcrR family transcriptional regulator